jgi:predicted ribosomally synthesized peptide with nif11-like leader
MDMASDSVKAFVKKMNRDNKFADRILQAVNDACILIAKEEGISITTQELDEALCILNDEQLDSVADGFGLARIQVKGEGPAEKPLN